MKKAVYLLFHSYGLDDNNIKLLGVFSEEYIAEQALAKAVKKEGFKIYPDGFNISRYVIDQEQWIDGFGIDGFGIDGDI